MSSKKLFYILTATIIVLFVAGGYGAYYGNSLLAEKSEELSALKLEQHANQIEQNIALRTNDKLEQYSDVIDLVRSVIPQDKNQAQTIAELDQIASEVGINLSGFTFPNSSLETQATTKPIVGAPKQFSQLTAVPGLSGVYSMEVRTQPEDPVPFSTFLTFLQKLETNRRTAQVASLSIAPDIDNPNFVTFNLSLTLYVKP